MQISYDMQNIIEYYRTLTKDNKNSSYISRIVICYIHSLLYFYYNTVLIL